MDNSLRYAGLDNTQENRAWTTVFAMLVWIIPKRTEHGQQFSLGWSGEHQTKQSMDICLRYEGLENTQENRAWTAVFVRVVWRIPKRTEHRQQSSLGWSGEYPREQSMDRSFREGWSGECPGKLTRALNGHHLFIDHALTCLSRVSRMTARA